MAAPNRDIFSKLLPNVKLTTRIDAEGREVQVEKREDLDATAKEEETFDMLVKAGYYRARIRGLSAFDKVVGGMTWCIECCDYDVDVDLLFHENLTIGQKIALVEKIVTVLPQMKCPYRIEPHQIQALEFLSIHPVIQWLVKTSVENRAERAEKLKRFAIGQFHNNFQLPSDKENLAKIRTASEYIKRIQQMYTPHRQYQRREATASDDELTRVRLTLLEYGCKTSSNMGDMGLSSTNSTSGSDVIESTSSQFEDDMKLDEHLLKNLILAAEDFSQSTGEQLNASERSALHQHYTEFKQEMDTDAKELTEQSQMNMLESTQAALEKKLASSRKENEELLAQLKHNEQLLEKEQAVTDELQKSINEYKATEHAVDPALLSEVQQLLRQHDELKREESEFKEHCRQDLAELQKKIDNLENFNAQSPDEKAAAVEKEKLIIQDLKLKLAKRNRGIVAIQRKLDTIPDRTELTQYQRRFHELYNEMSARHLETKQYYTLFNSLSDKQRYMEKELSLLNSICEAYNEGMLSQHGREDFIKQFEGIVVGVQQSEAKVRQRFNEERQRRDLLNDQLQALLELQRQYAAAVKQLTRECQRCEQLQQHLKTVQRK